MARPVGGKIHALPSEFHPLNFTNLCGHRMASIVGQTAHSYLSTHVAIGHRVSRVHR